MPLIRCIGMRSYPAAPTHQLVHILIVLSLLPEATAEPFGDQSRAYTSSACPGKVAFALQHGIGGVDRDGANRTSSQVWGLRVTRRIHFRDLSSAVGKRVIGEL